MTFHDRLHLSTALVQLPPTLCALLQASHVALALLRAGDDLLLQLRSAQEESSRILFMVEMVPVSVVTVEGMEAMVMVVVNALVMVEAVVEAMVVSVVEELPKLCLWAEVVAVPLRARFVAVLRCLKGLAPHLQTHQRFGAVMMAFPIVAKLMALHSVLDHCLHVRAAWQWALLVTFMVVATVPVAFHYGCHLLASLLEAQPEGLRTFLDAVVVSSTARLTRPEFPSQHLGWWRLDTSEIWLRPESLGLKYLRTLLVTDPISAASLVTIPRHAQSSAHLPE
mmetsp:Transcript_17622/g.36375  ORF Transcript_17622/g.36375 Transcript_17622/m.36375 type:complete len:281 (+) Transcript_17622:436-1278(+)